MRCSYARRKLHRLAQIGALCLCPGSPALRLMSRSAGMMLLVALLALCAPLQAFVVYGFAGSGCSGTMTPIPASGSTSSNTFVRNGADPSPAQRRATCYSTSEAFKSVAVASGTNLAVYTFAGVTRLSFRADRADTSCSQGRWLQLEFNNPGTPAAGETSYRPFGRVRNIPLKAQARGRSATAPIAIAASATRRRPASSSKAWRCASSTATQLRPSSRPAARLLSRNRSRSRNRNRSRSRSRNLSLNLSLARRPIRTHRSSSPCPTVSRRRSSDSRRSFTTDAARLSDASHPSPSLSSPFSPCPPACSVSAFASPEPTSNLVPPLAAPRDRVDAVCMDASDYRHDIGDGLVLRWSTSADRAGIALVAALAFGQDEGHEADGIIRTAERCAMDEFYNGSSCVVKPARPLISQHGLGGLHRHLVPADTDSSGVLGAARRWRQPRVCRVDSRRVSSSQRARRSVVVIAHCLPSRSRCHLAMPADVAL